jgi:hypothetical protein
MEFKINEITYFAVKKIKGVKWWGLESRESELHGRYRVNREILCKHVAQRYQTYLKK